MEVDQTRHISSALRRYVTLFEQFVKGEVTASQFEDTYTDWLLADPVVWDPSVSDVLNRVFADADAYVESDDLRPEVIDSIGADELLRSVSWALNELRAS